MTASAPSPIHPAFVTTLPAVPGYPTARALGVVAGVGAASGTTARTKAINAYNEAMESMCAMAADYGANAVVGVSASNFDSSIGGRLRRRGRRHAARNGRPYRDRLTAAEVVIDSINEPGHPVELVIHARDVRPA